MADRGWNWHAWSKKDGIRKYMGFFETEDSALIFKRKHADREFITITNYGPLDLAKQSAPKTTPTVKRGRAVAAVPMTREQMMERDRQRTARESAQAAAREESIRRDRERAAVTAEQRKAEAERRAQNEKDMAGIRKDAAAGLEKHKADEAADLKAGINR